MSDLKGKLLAIISVISVCIYPVIFLYTYNIDEVIIKQTFMASAVTVGAGVFLILINFAFTKSIYKSTIISNAILFVFLNYVILETGIRKLFYQLRYWHIIPILIFIIIHLAYFVYKKISEDTAKKISMLITFVFLGLIAVNIVTAVPIISKKISISLAAKKNISEEVIQQQNSDLPNLYYIVLDEYSNFDFMKKYYGYDNKKFDEFLQNNLFNISYDSKNESFGTHITTTNTLNLEYKFGNTADMPTVLEYRKEPKLLAIMDQNGYKISIASQNYPLYWKNELFDFSNPFGEKKFNSETNEFFKLLLNRTALYTLNAKQESFVQKKMTKSIFQFLNLEAVKSDKGRFVYAHILTPHTPFVFDEKGGNVPVSELYNWRDKKYYLNQYIYATNQIMIVLKNIVDSDPNSIIIVQSDHSARGSSEQDLQGMFDDTDKTQILNAVYYRGENIGEIKGQSGQNTIKIVLNKLLNANLKMGEPQD
jgi:hypothetical protein